jgi:hypothetical protein
MFSADGDLKLESGRNIHLEQFYQRKTYAGWLEGTPTRMWNEQIIQTHLERAQTYCVEGSHPVLIPPRRSTEADEWLTEHQLKHGWEPPESLPSIACIGQFKSFRPKPKDLEKDYSRLVVVWYQNDFGLPIDEQLLTQLKSIDWENLAIEDEY